MVADIVKQCASFILKRFYFMDIPGTLNQCTYPVFNPVLPKLKENSKLAYINLANSSADPVLKSHTFIDSVPSQSQRVWLYLNHRNRDRKRQWVFSHKGV